MPGTGCSHLGRIVGRQRRKRRTRLLGFAPGLCSSAQVSGSWTARVAAAAPGPSPRTRCSAGRAQHRAGVAFARAAAPLPGSFPFHPARGLCGEARWRITDFSSAS